MEILKLNTEKLYTSKYLVEQINLFRKEENIATELAHSDFLKKIEKEFEEEIAEGNISYCLITKELAVGSTRSKQYELNFEQSLQILMSESKSVRKKCVEVLKAQQQQIETLKAIIPSYQIKDEIERATMWIAERKEVLALQQTNEELVVKNEKLQFRSDFVDNVFDADGVFSMEQVAKVLNLTYGRNKMMEQLRYWKILLKSNTPPQNLIDRGYFKVVEELIELRSFKKLVATTLVTGKGVGYIYKKFKEDGEHNFNIEI